MNEWRATYGSDGLRIVAIQGYGELNANIIEDLGITYPVADDRDRDTWEAYGMRAYPSWAVIAADGSLAGRGVGNVTSGEALRLIEQEIAG